MYRRILAVNILVYCAVIIARFRNVLWFPSFLSEAEIREKFSYTVIKVGSLTPGPALFPVTLFALIILLLCSLPNAWSCSEKTTVH